MSHTEVKVALRVQRNQSSLSGQGYCFGAVGGAELTHDGTDVEFGGALANDKVRGNLLVGHALRQQREHLEFALGKCFVEWRLRCGVGRVDSLGRVYRV